MITLKIKLSKSEITSIIERVSFINRLIDDSTIAGIVLKKNLDSICDRGLRLLLKHRYSGSKKSINFALNINEYYSALSFYKSNQHLVSLNDLTDYKNFCMHNLFQKCLSELLKHINNAGGSYPEGIN